jgi:hypothetical protein
MTDSRAGRRRVAPSTIMAISMITAVITIIIITAGIPIT